MKIIDAFNTARQQDPLGRGRFADVFAISDDLVLRCPRGVPDYTTSMNIQLINLNLEGINVGQPVAQVGNFTVCLRVQGISLLTRKLQQINFSKNWEEQEFTAYKSVMQQLESMPQDSYRQLVATVATLRTHGHAIDPEGDNLMIADTRFGLVDLDFNHSERAQILNTPEKLLLLLLANVPDVGIPFLESADQELRQARGNILHKLLRACELERLGPRPDYTDDHVMTQRLIKILGSQDAAATYLQELKAIMPTEPSMAPNTQNPSEYSGSPPTTLSLTDEFSCFTSAVRPLILAQTRERGLSR